MNSAPFRNVSPEKIAQLIGVIKLFAAIMILAGVSIWLNAGGIAVRLGLDATTQKIMAGALMALGFLEFFLMPKLLRRSRKIDDKAL